MAAANPGLARRFQMENAFVFQDYDDAALVRILRSRCKKDGLGIDLDTANYAISQLARARAQPNFGNAGAVNNLLGRAKLCMQARLAKLPPSARKDILIREDFASDDLSGLNEDDIFAGIVGCDNLMRLFQEYKGAVSMSKDKGRDPRESVGWNFLFVGMYDETLVTDPLLCCCRTDRKEKLK